MNEVRPPTTGPLGAVVSVIIPCLDEETAIAGVVRSVLFQGVAEVIVVDGGSRDHSVERAIQAGARVLVEPEPGYGRAVQAGIKLARPDAEVLLFIDGDGSDRSELMPALVAPIVKARASFVQGSRILGEREPGALLLQQVLAGHLAGLLLRLAYGVRFTDISPYRAIRRDVFDQLGMRDMTYGWNLEMLMRVAAAAVPVAEVAVGQRRRLGGVSKVTGRFSASLRATLVIAATFLRLFLILRRERKRDADART